MRFSVQKNFSIPAEQDQYLLIFLDILEDFITEIFFNPGIY